MLIEHSSRDGNTKQATQKENKKNIKYTSIQNFHTKLLFYTFFKPNSASTITNRREISKLKKYILRSR